MAIGDWNRARRHRLCWIAALVFVVGCLTAIAQDFSAARALYSEVEPALESDAATRALFQRAESLPEATLEAFGKALDASVTARSQRFPSGLERGGVAVIKERMKTPAWAASAKSAKKFAELAGNSADLDADQFLATAQALTEQLGQVRMCSEEQVFEASPKLAEEAERVERLILLSDWTNQKLNPGAPVSGGSPSLAIETDLVLGRAVATASGSPTATTIMRANRAGEEDIQVVVALRRINAMRIAMGRAPLARDRDLSEFAANNAEELKALSAESVQDLKENNLTAPRNDPKLIFHSGFRFLGNADGRRAGDHPLTLSFGIPFYSSSATRRAGIGRSGVYWVMLFRDK